ncbi:hypothetical protein CBS470a_012984 [Colletotrichum nupharicola]|nr:hypothetical protein CBS470a_012984 [Colletotrichum nupharicola]
MVVTRVRPSWWMGSCMAVWAVISGLTAVSKDYTGLLLTRFFLGITEAPYYPGALIILGWVSATCSQTKEKKASSLAIVNCIAVSSFIWTPYMWPKSDEPRYVMAMSTSAALSVATAAGAWAMRFWLKHENKKIRQSEDETVLFYAY